MTDNNHPITPPPELVQQWQVAWYCSKVKPAEYELYIANCAAKWGADQELEACCEAIKNRMWFAQPTSRLAELRAARRPKPPSLKKQALQVLGSPIMSGESRLIGHRDHDLLRRVLEALPDND